MKKYFLFQDVTISYNRLLGVIFSIFYLSFCSCTSVTPKSEWKDLESSQDIGCYPIGYNNDILAIKDVLIEDNKMVILSLDRKGGESYYLTDILKRGVNSNFVKLNIDNGYRVSDFFKYKDKFYLSLYYKDSINIVNLDLKSVFEYKVFESRFKRFSFLNTFLSGNILWVVYSLEDDNSYDENPIEIVGFSIDQGFKKIGEYHYSNETSFSKKFLVNTSKNSFIIVDRSRTDDKDVFMIEEFLKEGSLKYKIDSLNVNIENFSSKVDGNYIYLSLVEGDSLIGESKISIYKYDLNTTLVKEDNKDNKDNKDSKNKKDSKEVINLKLVAKSFKDIELAHVSEPVWNEGSSSLELLVFKWLDNESTIGSYSFKEDKNEIISVDLGIFPNSSRIEKTYSIEDKDFIVIKTQDKYFGQYSICRLR